MGRPRVTQKNSFSHFLFYLCYLPLVVKSSYNSRAFRPEDSTTFLFLPTHVISYNVSIQTLLRFSVSIRIYFVVLRLYLFAVVLCICSLLQHQCCVKLTASSRTHTEIHRIQKKLKMKSTQHARRYFNAALVYSQLLE